MTNITPIGHDTNNRRGKESRVCQVAGWKGAFIKRDNWTQLSRPLPVFWGQRDSDSEPTQYEVLIEGGQPDVLLSSDR